MYDIHYSKDTNTTWYYPLDMPFSYCNWSFRCWDWI